MSNRDALRSLAVKTVERHRQSFEYEGNTYEVVSPNVKEYTAIVSKSKNTMDTTLWALIYLTVVPGTLEKVFEDTDYATLENLALHGFISAAQDAIVKAMQPKGADYGPKDTEISS